MRDIELNSRVLRIDSMPKDTTKIMIMYDERGWAIRCYNEPGDKLTTLVPDKRLGDSSSDETLVPIEEL